MSNGQRYVRFFDGEGNPKLEKEFLASPKSKVVYGDMGNQLIEISKEDYDTFGKTWHFGGKWCSRSEI